MASEIRSTKGKGIKYKVSKNTSASLSGELRISEMKLCNPLACDAPVISDTLTLANMDVIFAVLLV